MKPIIRPKIVFVPYEQKNEVWLRADDLPRFLTTKQVLRFLHENQRAFARRRLDWREEWEPDSIDEYLAGVGTKPTLILRN